MSELQPPGINQEEIINCDVTICRSANSVMPESQRSCLYAMQTDPTTENFEDMNISYDQFLEVQNKLRDKCLYGGTVYSFRKNSK